MRDASEHCAELRRIAQNCAELRRIARRYVCEMFEKLAPIQSIRCVVMFCVHRRGTLWHRNGRV